MLKDHTRPVSVLCTTTLEMGIDIGDMKAIAQLGAPPSVTSLRQRLGRSGRRGGAALLRAYVAEPALTKDSPLQDALHAEADRRHERGIAKGDGTPDPGPALSFRLFRNNAAHNR